MNSATRHPRDKSWRASIGSLHIPSLEARKKPHHLGWCFPIFLPLLPWRRKQRIHDSNARFQVSQTWRHSKEIPSSSAIIPFPISFLEKLKRKYEEGGRGGDEIFAPNPKIRKERNLGCVKDRSDEEARPRQISPGGEKRGP